jgi:hypothetical protein
MLGKTKPKTLMMILPAVVVVLLVGILVRRKPYGPFAWGKGNLTVSERTYYKNCFERIIREWRRRPERVERDINGVPTYDYDVYLVIDTARSGIWIEDNGVMLQEYYMDLPEGMKWKFYRCSPVGNEELPAKVRLKIRCYYWNSIHPEKIYLHGYGRGNDHLSFSITSGRGRYDYGEGSFSIQKSWGKYDNGKDYYDSIVVGDAEYTQFLESIKTEKLSGQSGEGHKATENEEVLRWMTIEKRFYQQIEKQISLNGHVLEQLVVSCSGDCKRAFAHIEAELDEGFMVFNRWNPRRFRGVECNLKVDYLGEGIWYAKSAPTFQWDNRKRFLDLEFLVHGRADMSKSEREKWVEQGRKEHPIVTNPTSKWKVTLANGVVVELLGVCTSPSIAGHWWGADGSALEYEPAFYSGGKRKRIMDKSHFVFAFRFNWPAGTNSSDIQFEVVGGSGEGYLGRDGRHNNFEVMVLQELEFDETAEEGGVEFWISRDRGQEESVRFKNISLVPGEDHGFETEVEK